MLFSTFIDNVMPYKIHENHANACTALGNLSISFSLSPKQVIKVAKKQYLISIPNLLNQRYWPTF